MYQKAITKLAPGYDSRHIEAYMRLEHPTLDGMSREQFAWEVGLAIACVDLGGAEMAERTAKSFGL